MNTLLRSDFLRRMARAATIATLVAALTACTHAMAGDGGAKRPAAAEFGLGPRSSAQGFYVATLATERELKPRQMYTVRITITGRDGQPIDDAVLTIGGGMPQHGHGLPTRPRVTRHLGGGTYEIEGLRFNMGGWWELEVSIAARGGTDAVTFNLDL